MYIKRLFVLLAAGAALLNAQIAKAEELNPVADPSAIVESGNVRFTVLTPEMIRIEWRSNKAYNFVDNATFTVINRRLPVPQFTTREADGYLYIETEKLNLRYRIGSTITPTTPATSENLRIAFDLDGHTTVWYPGKADAHNLKGTCRTLDFSDGDSKRAELEDGLISRSGWALIDDTGIRGDGSKSLLFEPNDRVGFDWLAQRIDKNGIDIYFLGYGHEYKKALYDFTCIAGKIPMPPLYAFGYWYSKYQRYSENDFKDIVNEVRQYDVPLDVMVVDTDWHINEWTGWSWNRELFPDPQEFVGWMHDKNLNVTLNLHPAYGVNSNEDNFGAFTADLGITDNPDNVAWNLESANFYRSFFKNILRPHENIGVDFWWLDWQQWLLSDIVDGLGQTFWLNHVFYNDMVVNHPERRAMIFHRWGGLGNHRYPIGFSGDSNSTFPSLAFETYFTATASNVGYGYWSHDIGGHMQPGANNAELYLRWMQFGVFSPILRTHSSSYPHIERRIWKYSNFDLLKRAVELRYALIPYIYTQARVAYDTGISICRPLYYDHPEANEAYDWEGEYMFGNDILANPITKAAQTSDRSISWKTWLPKGDWYDVCRHRLVKGDNVLTDTYSQAEIPYFYRAGAIIPNYPRQTNLKHRPDNLILQFAPGADGSLDLYEDDNSSESYRDGAFATTHISQIRTENTIDCTIEAIEGYFEGMPTQRSYTLQFLGGVVPTKVEVNGVEYESVTAGTEQGYWADNFGTLVVNIPTTSCSTAINVKIDGDFSGISSAVAFVGSANKLYYNAATEEICASVHGAYVLSIFDNAGHKVAELQADDESSISTQGMAPGVYVARLTQGNANLTCKFVK